MVRERRAAVAARTSLYIATDGIQQKSLANRMLVKSEIFWIDRLR